MDSVPVSSPGNNPMTFTDPTGMSAVNSLYAGVIGRDDDSYPLVHYVPGVTGNPLGLRNSDDAIYGNADAALANGFDFHAVESLAHNNSAQFFYQTGTSERDVDNNTEPTLAGLRSTGYLTGSQNAVNLSFNPPPPSPGFVRVMGGVQAVGGIVQTGLGLGSSTLGVGVPLVALGVDNIQAGIQNMLWGQGARTVLNRGLGLVADQQHANDLEVMINLGASGVGAKNFDANLLAQRVPNITKLGNGAFEPAMQFLADEAGGRPIANPYLKGKTPIAGTRSTGVARAARLEVELVRRTGTGTVPWTADEVQSIKTTGELPVDVVGHHINSVVVFPKWAGDPRNIMFVRGRIGNLVEHGGYYRNPTVGPLIDREAMFNDGNR